MLRTHVFRRWGLSRWAAPTRLSGWAALWLFVASVCGLSAAAPLRAQMPGSANPILQADAVKRVSDHVYVIMGFPNVAFVVGDRATLVVDTGMGARNGATVWGAAQKLARPNSNFYLTTTHFHPEHASGAQAFPPSAVLMRPVAQQQEMDQHGGEFIDRFRGMLPVYKGLLQDVTLRRADVAFDGELHLDLGGATVRLFWLGPAHTAGDELIFVAPDSALLPGDIVMSKLVPNMPTPEASPKNWLAILDKIELLHPQYVVPDHGDLGDGALIGRERSFLGDLQARALDLKRGGTSVEDAGRQLTSEFQKKYPDYGNMPGVANVVRRVYEEAK